ncbi:MAG: hypothetical protein ACR2PL_14045 [Dehalococcoidia bacterium]
MTDQEHDRIDSLMARMEQIDPPDDFVSRLMDRITAEAYEARHRPVSRAGLLYAAVYLLALMALGLFAYRLGIDMAHNGSSSLIVAILGNVQLLREAPGALFSALSASIPWSEAGAVAGDVILISLLTRLILRSSQPGNRAATPR